MAYLWKMRDWESCETLTQREGMMLSISVLQLCVCPHHSAHTSNESIIRIWHFLLTVQIAELLVRCGESGVLWYVHQSSGKSAWHRLYQGTVSPVITAFRHYWLGFDLSHREKDQLGTCFLVYSFLFQCQWI